MYKLKIIIFLLLGYYVGVYAQSLQANAKNLDALDLLLKQQTPEISALSVPLEKIVDPTEYVLGPGDVLRIVVDARNDVSSQVTVGPEGSIFVPAVGEISVANLTLADAKHKISETLKLKYVANKVDVMLLQIRTFRVSVNGAVNSPGMVTVAAYNRVSEAITIADGFRTGEKPQPIIMQPQMMSTQNGQMVQEAPVEEEPEKKSDIPERGKKASKRNIKLIRQNSEMLDVDLLKYYLTGNLDANPYLHDGDVIFVPFEQVEFGRVEIRGAVRAPGNFEFVSGETINDLFDLAHGLTIDADSSKIELVRFGPINGKAVRIVRPLDSEILNVKLLPDDRIYVRSKPKFHYKINVEIQGEVAYPGYYALDNKDRTLSGLLERAGGFTDNASLKNSFVVREFYSTQDDPEFERLKTMRVTEMTEIEREYLKTKYREQEAIVAVDFVSLFENGDKSSDVLLRDKDLIYVPFKDNTVKLSGQVMRPGLFAFFPDKDLDFYIEQAGGYSWNARKHQVRIIRAETGEWTKAKGNTKIQIGDTIFVPEKPERTWSWWEIGRDIITVAVQLATIWIVIDRYGTNDSSN